MEINALGSRIVVFGALTCLTGGCASALTGNYGVPVDDVNRPIAATAPSPLLVSAREAARYSTRYLGLVEVTFENRTPVWKQIDRVAVDFGSPAKDQSVRIASGSEIGAWERAIMIRNDIPGSSADTAIEALVFRSSVDTIGDWIGQQQGVTVASVASGAPAAAGPEPSAAPAMPSYPDQHLLTVPLAIPPGLFTKRWILLYTPDNPRGGCIDSMILSYETSDHQTGRLLLPFKIPSTDWQPGCGVGMNPAPGSPVAGSGMNPAPIDRSSP